MRQDLSPRELEQLSAYLDSRLPPNAKAHVEARIAAEPDFAAALHQLERTRALLRRAPQRRAPRNFTLSPQMIGDVRPAGVGGWTSLNLVSAVAGLLLVAVLVGDFTVNGLPMFGLFAPASEAEEPMALMAGEAAAEEAPPDQAAPAEDTAGTRQAEEVEPFDWRSLVIQYARPAEIVLGSALAISLLAAWRRKRSQNS